MAGHVVGMVVGLEHVLDRDADVAGRAQVVADVELGVHHGGDAGVLVTDQVRGTAEVVMDELAEHHGRAIIAARGVGDQPSLSSPPAVPHKLRSRFGTATGGYGSTRPMSTAILKRTVREFRDEHLTDWAAALTYYGVLALFPALIALVSLVGLVGDPQETTDALNEIVADLGPSSAADTFQGPIESITANRERAGVLFFAGLAGALYSASGYVGAFMRASNVIYDVEEGRPFWKLRPLQIGVTLVMVLLVALVSLALVLSGPLAQSVGDAIGLSDDRGRRLPAGEVAVRGAGGAHDGRAALLRLAEREAAGPALDHPRQRAGARPVGAGLGWRSPSTWATSAPTTRPTAPWAGSSASSCGYGSRTSRCSWGLELNAELERSRELEAGIRGAAEEIQLPPREDPG